MKTIKYITILLVGAVVFSCTKTQFEEFDETTGGSADFTTYIAVGNSLTQGYQDDGLHNEYQQQENSFPAIIAQQMGANFSQPMVDGAGSGYKFLQALGVSPTISDVLPDGNWGSAGWGTWNKTLKYNNLGVAGIRLEDCVPPFNPTHNAVNAGNPFGAFLDLQTKSYLENVKSSNATFFTCWLGNNDVLGWSTNGGNDSAAVPGIPGLVDNKQLTNPTTFRNKYDSILDAFQAMGAKGVCATLPDVTSLPFFTTVPHNPVPLDAATAASLNSSYAAYNGGLDGLVLAGSLSASEAAQRKISFVDGPTNALVIIDESLTDFSSSGLPSMRQATSADLILLTSSSDIGRELVSGDPTTALGVAVPFEDKLVLTEAEVVEVVNHTNMLNNEIRNSAAAHGLPVVDMNAFMKTFLTGITFDGVDYSTKFIEGGAFSLDGVHPNTRGYAIIANKFMEAINETYGANLRPVSVQSYRGIIFP